MINKAYHFICLILIGTSLLSCDKGELLQNQEPETRTTLESINLTGSNRLNTVVELEWSGTDKDGLVVGYEISFDNSKWDFVTVQDSIFKFTISSGSDTSDIKFYVRAVDNDGLKDLTPATLVIPIKNTPPSVSFNDALSPVDSVQSVVTFSFSASDLDGNNSIDSIYIKANSGNWYGIKRDASFISIIPVNPSVAGSGQAHVYYGTTAPQSVKLNGIRVQDTNTFYIKAIDISGAESQLDTISNIFIKRKTADLLLIGSHILNPYNFYSTNISAFSSFDFLDYKVSSGKYQPKLWNPTFELMIGLYDKVVMYTDESTSPNAVNGQSALIIEHAASSYQKYLDQGGKIMLSAAFPNNFSNNSSVFGTLPADSLVRSVGQAFLTTDSSLTPLISTYPVLKPSEFVLSLDPFYPSADAEVVYRGRFTKSGGWNGLQYMAARRKNNSGKTNMFYISMDLHKLNGDPVAAKKLFEQILTNEFNW